MKNCMLIILCFALNLANGQLTEEAKIDIEIEKAKELSFDKPTEAMAISEKVYRTSQKIGYNHGILESSNNLMVNYFDLGNFKKVIELSKTAEEVAINIQNNTILSNIYRLRASSYTELGFNEESFKEFKKALYVTYKVKSQNYRYYQQSLIYIGLASYSAHVNMPVDSVIYYQKKCLETITKLDNSREFINKKYYTLALANINLGMSCSALQHTRDAKKHFVKALEICLNKKYKVNKNLHVTVLNEFSWLYYDHGNYNEAIHYAGQAEQLEKQHKSPYIRRDIYEVYFKSCVELGEKETSKKYMNLYTQLNDSLVNGEKIAINTPAKYLVENQKDIHTANIQKLLGIILISSILFLATGWLFWKRNQNKLHEKYKTIIENLTKSDKTQMINLENNIIPEKNIGLTDETIRMILCKLDEFEDSKKFLQRELSLTSLAYDLKTNTRSLSEIIKLYRKKNYNNYINNLRIMYIITKLYEVPLYRQYKISYLAEESGFSSREVFAMIFKKETGVSPSYFINNIKKESTEISAIPIGNNVSNGNNTVIVKKQ